MKTIPVLPVLLFIAVTMISLTDQASAQTLPSFSTSLFAGPGDCQFCHAAGTGVLTSASGEDISPPAHWQSSMMANAAKDPFWQAKVSSEVIENPALAAAIENKCTTCHAPMGNMQSRYDGGESYSMETLAADIPGLDGVSCTVCHQVRDSRSAVPESFSGHYTITDERLIYGPYELPVAGQMQQRVNYTPTYSDHIGASELCATCHTLFTAYVDNDGNVGGAFPEQTPYLEWKNSRYPGEGTHCQTCHMPAVDEAMNIALRPFNLNSPRQPVRKHAFVGGNTIMPGIIGTNAADTGSYAAPNAIDTTVLDARASLREKTVGLTAAADVEDNTLIVDVGLTNLCGHKFPSGYPSRQAWIHVLVEGDNGDMVFESGSPAEIDVLEGAGGTFQPHHDVITGSGQVQIYEAVMGDVDGKVTSTLLRAASYLKDNRIPPAGFTGAFEDYGDIAVTGAAVQDADFNRDNTGEGSGGDTVHYRIPLSGGHSEYSVTVSLCYRSISGRYAADLFTHDSPEVAAFRTMYESADSSAELLQTVTVTVSAPLDVEQRGSVPETFRLGNFPNPFNAATTITVTIPARDNVSLSVYTVTGQRIADIYEGVLDRGVHSFSWNGSTAGGGKANSGLYICEMRANGLAVSRKMTLLE